MAPLRVQPLLRHLYVFNLLRPLSTAMADTINSSISSVGEEGWSKVDDRSDTALRPLDRPNNAFYLTPLLKPFDSCWFSYVPIGKNKLSSAIASMCKSAGIEGYKINHFLRAIAATRLVWINSLLWRGQDTAAPKESDRT